MRYFNLKEKSMHPIERTLILILLLIILIIVWGDSSTDIEQPNVSIISKPIPPPTYFKKQNRWYLSTPNALPFFEECFKDQKFIIITMDNRNYKIAGPIGKCSE